MKGTSTASGADIIASHRATIPLLRSMIVRLSDDAPIWDSARRFAALNGWTEPVPGWVRVKVGELGVITVSEGDLSHEHLDLAECRFADCTIIVDRTMVEVA